MPADAAGTWPVTLVEGPVTLRPLRRRDRRAWLDLRAANAAWLRPWDATSPVGAPPTSFGAYLRSQDRQGRSGEGLPFVVEVDGDLVGQVSIMTIVRGALWSGSVGYWISRHVAGRGITPWAVATACDYAWGALGLHRLEVNVRPENGPSLRVVAKLGFREEGLRRRFLHIDGDWRDHRSFALTAEEVPGGLVRRLRAAGQVPR
ncbi:GNAT family N-acetyltransferase [Georgenia sp. TF02-10]|uniref:GNAT family N-acetyltransferase n=1 Tax=Georgenia sp. TF02-10 TaxID=2917725 RepID=UPI001FA6BD10|nr:GNAT family protein [Georgenia sp. TF02-10]UNX55457.1 GNAT family N-acetyltransferase [Georgenia sp. TF02-10]